MKRFNWKEMKKSDWLVIGLAGVLLLVLALPTESRRGTGEADNGGNSKGTGLQEETGPVSQTGYKTTDEKELYVQGLEEKLEEVLSAMEGVGTVKVMITVSDAGERVVEKDSILRETASGDGADGSRTVSEQDVGEETVYVKTEDETYPYVQKEKVPTIEGVAVVAEGGGNPAVVSAISDTVGALFQVEVHRIKVVKMSSREESK